MRPASWTLFLAKMPTKHPHMIEKSALHRSQIPWNFTQDTIYFLTHIHLMSWKSAKAYFWSIPLLTGHFHMTIRYFKWLPSLHRWNLSHSWWGPQKLYSLNLNLPISSTAHWSLCCEIIAFFLNDHLTCCYNFPYNSMSSVFLWTCIISHWHLHSERRLCHP